MKLMEDGIVCFRAITVVLFVLNITKFFNSKKAETTLFDTIT